MGKFKGAGITVLTKLLEDKSRDSLDAFKYSLSTEENNWFKIATPATWIPVDVAASLSHKAADRLFPGDPLALRLLGRARARENVNAIYKVFMKILSPETVIKHSAKLWSQHHDTGRAWVETTRHPNHAFYCVSDYPELPEIFRKIIEGFVIEVLTMAGCKNIQTRIYEEDASCWKWGATWD